jgi:phage terminase small subunit
VGASKGRPNVTERAAGLAKELKLNLAAIEGTGKDGRITVADVRAVGELSDGNPPPILPPVGKRLWLEVRSYLEDFDLWRPVYADLLERYVRNLVRSRWARGIAEANPTVEGSTGQMVANPLFQVARNAELDAHKYAEALLITPEALKRHLRGVASPEEDDLGF